MGIVPANGTKIHPSAFILHPCSSAGLVIEVDGDVHDLQQEEGQRREPPLSFGHLPQIRQWKFGMKIESLNRRIWGRLRDGHFLQTRQNSSFCIHHSSLPFGNDEVVRNLSAVVGMIRELIA